MVKKLPQPYFSRPGFTLYHGDCLDILSRLNGESVDMVFADPPYNLSNDGFTCHAGRRASVNKGDWDKSKGLDDDFRFHSEWIAGCKRVLKDSGTLWISGTYHSIYSCGFVLQLEGYHLLNDICWFKPNAAPNLSCRCFAASHETILWARKSKDAKHTFNYGEMKNGMWPEDAMKKSGKHPTQKPIDLLRRVVLASTNEGDIVVDPFTGSSTTGLVAALHGREYIGIDNNKDYLELSIKRYEGMEKKQRTKKIDKF